MTCKKSDDTWTFMDANKGGEYVYLKVLMMGFHLHVIFGYVLASDHLSQKTTHACGGNGGLLEVIKSLLS